MPAGLSGSMKAVRTKVEDDGAQVVEGKELELGLRLDEEIDGKRGHAS